MAASNTTHYWPLELHSVTSLVAPHRSACTIALRAVEVALGVAIVMTLYLYKTKSGKVLFVSHFWLEVV